MYKVPEDRNFYEYRGTPNSRVRKARTGLFGVLQTSILLQVIVRTFSVYPPYSPASGGKRIAFPRLRGTEGGELNSPALAGGGECKIV